MKQNEGIMQGRIIRGIRRLFKQKEEDYYEPKRVNNFLNSNYIESNGDKNRDLSLDEYLNNISPYLRNIIIDLRNFDTWRIQLTTAINSKDAEEEWLMHPSSDNIKFTPFSDANDVIDKSQFLQDIKKIQKHQ